MEEPLLEEPVKAVENRRPDGTFGAGNNANPNGRPKGKTLKEYQAEKFRQMTDIEKEEWLKDVSKSEKWRMSEGNPKQDTDITSAGQPIIQIAKEVVEKNSLNDINTSTELDSSGQSPLQSS